MAITYHAGRRIQGTSTTTDEYKLHTFTGDGTFQITAGSGNVDYVIIAGGGGGGGTAANWAGGGGGGAGGYITNNASLSTNSYSVVRGTGGAGASAGGNKGANGLNSSFNSQTAIGGGGGAGSASSGAQSASGGGSGGGGSYSENAGGAGTSGQGFAGSNNHGANSGGGGGASEVGSTNGNMIGGDGKLFSLTNTYYAGGGGGGQWGNGSTTVGAASAGGLGGGGGGSGNANGQDATANTGSGGGGGGGTTNTPARGGGAGADGIILIYYLNDGSITATGGTITTSDLTTTAAKPTDVQVGSRFEETDTRKMYNYTAPATAPTTTSHLEGHGQGVPNVTDTIDIPTTGLSNLATGSVSFWIYLETESTSAGDYVVLSGSNTGVASSEFALGFVGHVTGVGIICRNNGSGVCTFNCPSSLTRNAWNHVVYTNNSSGNKVYVNGSQVTPSYSVGSASTNAFFNSVASINTCTIGANKDNGGYQWGYDGNLQQLLVYSAVLTQGEITALYNNGKYVEPSTTNLLRRYELTSNANDTSGNGHNGTASAGVTYTSLAIPEGSNEWKEIGT